MKLEINNDGKYMVTIDGQQITLERLCPVGSESTVLFAGREAGGDDTGDGGRSRGSCARSPGEAQAALEWAIDLAKERAESHRIKAKEHNHRGNLMAMDTETWRAVEAERRANALGWLLLPKPDSERSERPANR